jgi:FkbM family methyltransferase
VVLGRVKKWPYYLRALLKLGQSLRNPLAIARVVRGQPTALYFKSGFSLTVAAPLDLLVVAELILMDCYGLKKCKNPTVIIDIGGALGEFGLFAAHHFTSAHVTILEPSPRSFSLLQENKTLNALDNVDPQQACVGPEKTYLFSTHHSGQNSLLESGSDLTAVAGVALEDVITEEVDLLKVDTEGFEIPVLKSAGKKLQKVRHIALEYHEGIVPGQRKELEIFLQNEGFQVTTLPDPYTADFGLMFARRK